MRVPLRLVVGGQYSDAALAVYIKVAALALRAEGCTARVATLAEYLGMSKSAVERALRQLARPDSVDGVVEVLTTRRTRRGGTGDSAHRTVRVAEDDELFVWVPARAATSLPPRLLRLYAVIAYAQARRQPLAYSDLAAVVRHQGGKSAGESLGERQTARLVEDLAATGWVTVRRREGLQGRHAYEAHDRPLHAVPGCADIHDGSGAGRSDGSLASEEDHGTDRLKTSATGGGGIRRRRVQEVAQGPVDNPARSAPLGRPGGRGHGEKRSSSGGSGDGSGALLSACSWTVLEPVRHLLEDVRPFVLRRIDAEITAQLAAGTGMQRITERLTRRYATTDPVRDGGRWILGAGLPRRGCGLDVCEDGVLWHTGQPCQVCLDITLATPPAGAAPAAEPPVPEPPEAPPAPAPAPAPPPAAPAEAHGGRLPELTAEQKAALRAAAGPGTVRAAVAQYGRTAAVYLYGWRAVAPALTALDDTEGAHHAQ
ncbi:hypothetical protein BJP40_02640 [Streptomyces sp. CC53]|uniref:helix-turn-helix domain-containing protein n=1 Tax=Streptomyces sp. CC53 TaxID=1906740 RepID=UPI0008DE4557|nr:helix-turn-helix domain-containing protein [Streptomyces sp. CC53]OII63796.1 hypothetical protein BJP40_02640 [Streptomyces sp. CC53]